MEIAPIEGGFSDVVKKAVALLLADDGAGALAGRLVVVDMGVVDPGSFVAFGSLTLSIVSGWVEAVLGADLDTLKASLDVEVDDIVNTPTVSPPWV